MVLSNSSTTSTNWDQAELSKFDNSAAQCWDPDSPVFAPLHQINPLRVGWINRHAPLALQSVLDVGCGGGILSEAMALQGGRVTGIDLSSALIQVARLHRIETNVSVDYHCGSIEDWVAGSNPPVDILTCMELLEHVPDPEALVHCCAKQVRDGGVLFFSTIHRCWQAYMQAVLGAEYVLGLLPRGTHRYAYFIKPSELARSCRRAGLEVRSLRGLGYNPLSRRYFLTDDVSVNYMLYAVKTASGHAE